MRYQWDKNKAAANLSKHGIDFADAVSVFSDELAITISEDRFKELDCCDLPEPFPNQVFSVVQ